MDECRILDNLPAAMVKYREEAGVSTKMYEAGFPIGFKATTEEVCTAARRIALRSATTAL